MSKKKSNKSTQSSRSVSSSEAVTDDKGLDNSAGDENFAETVTTETSDKEDKNSQEDSTDESSAALVADGKPVSEKVVEDAKESSSSAETVVEKNHAPSPAADKGSSIKRRFPWFGLFNLFLIIILAAAVFWYWLEQQKRDNAQSGSVSELRQTLSQKLDRNEIQGQIAPIASEIITVEKQVAELEQSQLQLSRASEKLYELYGRDRNDWQYAEVEYLLRIAQHKLILQNDFEGAATTLQAASDKLAFSGDPGMLPVRVRISDEIAELKTRKRPDLVGMTLLLSQLNKQLQGLKPGFIINRLESFEPVEVNSENLTWTETAIQYVNSLFRFEKDNSAPTAIEATVVDVDEQLTDHLKLARWSVLERDGRQFKQLMIRSVQLFDQFYNLDDAANSDFRNQLVGLSQSEIQPDLPDISQSLQLLQKILSQREIAPVEQSSSDADLNGETSND